jgi:hypothetical protein
VCDWRAMWVVGVSFGGRSDSREPLAGGVGWGCQLAGGVTPPDSRPIGFHGVSKRVQLGRGRTYPKPGLLGVCNAIPIWLPGDAKLAAKELAAK